MKYDVGPSGTRVLLALLEERAEHGRATVRTVADRSGLSVSVVHRHLTILRELGLVDWEPGNRGTLRPLVAAA